MMMQGAFFLIDFLLTRRPGFDFRQHALAWHPIRHAHVHAATALHDTARHTCTNSSMCDKQGRHAHLHV